MILAFIDESGYTPDWEAGIAQQPFYALGAVAIPHSSLGTTHAAYRKVIAGINLGFDVEKIGRGAEIKGRDLASGGGLWAKNNGERNTIRDALLTIPKQHGGFGILVVVDKAAHKEKYHSPDDPYRLAWQFLLERLATHCGTISESAYCVYDQNSRLQEALLEDSGRMVREGGSVTAYSSFYGQLVDYKIPTQCILEVAIGDSRYSIGLQFADALASFGYAYHKQGKPSSCGWWVTLESGLRTYKGSHVGAGYKLFP